MPETPDPSGTAPLRRGLSQRQLNMIALGGVIGAGLFVGSGVIIGEAGPGAFITYALCGVLVVLVMRMLGEMATANPSTGSFADYARQALGGWAGFSVGWLYWYFWVVVIGFEAIAGGAVLSYWIDAPLWLLSLVLLVAMTATNLFSVASFGEFEFWFAGIKVAAIVAFLALGSLFVLGFWPGAASTSATSPHTVASSRTGSARYSATSRWSSARWSAPKWPPSPPPKPRIPSGRWRGRPNRWSCGS